VTGPAPEYARIDLSPAGFTLSLGTGDAGQGHATTFLQVLDAHLGLKPEGGVVVAGDTGRVARGTGTFGSRSAAAAGSALTIAALALRDKLVVEAADHLEAAVADIEFTRGAFRVVGTDRSVTTAELVRVRGLTLAEERFVGTAAPTFPNGCHVAEVEIDPETGALEIMRYLVVDDVGTALNPLLVKGQIQGGVVQGIGQVVMESIRYDAASGQLMTGSLMDYAVPRAGDVPALEVVMRPVPTAANILGVKGAGEAGTVGALPVIASAVADALSPLGIDHVDMPTTPARLWAIMEAAKNRRG
jgi:carbon-monoxide dehydrogenase large subunit